MTSVCGCHTDVKLFASILYLRDSKSTGTRAVDAAVLFCVMSSLEPHVPRTQAGPGKSTEIFIGTKAAAGSTCSKACEVSTSLLGCHLHFFALFFILCSSVLTHQEKAMAICSSPRTPARRRLPHKCPCSALHWGWVLSACACAYVLHPGPRGRSQCKMLPLHACLLKPRCKPSCWKHRQFLWFRLPKCYLERRNWAV